MLIRIEPDWNVKFNEFTALFIPTVIRIEPDWNVKDGTLLEGEVEYSLE